MTFSLSSFESDDLTCFDILKVYYALTNVELEILSAVHINQPVDIKGITEIIPKNRTTISRSIKRLMSIGFVKQDRICLEMGGYKYLYSTLSIKEIRERTTKLIERINNRMIGAMSQLTEKKCTQIYKEIKEKYPKKQTQKPNH